MKTKKVLLLIIVGIVALFLTTACENEEKTGKYDYLVLVNKYSQLPDDWEKNVELVDAKNAWDEDIQVEKEAYKNYKELEKEVNEDLKDLNASIVLDSTYRSVKAQQELWDEWAADPEKGIDYVKKFVAVPGFSEHHTGLAIDVCLKKDGELVYDNDEMIAETEIFKKVHAKLAKHGFILRYMKDREDSTGYTYEPWHFRYVGSEEIAKAITDSKLTLEEYLAKQPDFETNREAAKYQIEMALKEEFENKIYKESIVNSRFNVKKIYTPKDVQKEESMKDSVKLGEKDLAFEVEYQIQPAEGINVQELMVVDGEYDENLGWIKNINRLGILKYNEKNKKYTIENFGTGW